MILRPFEAHNTRGPVDRTLHPAVRQVIRCNVLEDDLQPVAADGETLRLPLRNYEIVTLRLLLD